MVSTISRAASREGIDRIIVLDVSPMEAERE
jgi:hypothetical protein